MNNIINKFLSLEIFIFYSPTLLKPKMSTNPKDTLTEDHERERPTREKEFAH